MVNPDTVKLLKECNSGIKLGISSIEEVLPSVECEGFRKILLISLEENKKIGEETSRALSESGDDGKEPHSVAKGMAWLKTNMKLLLEDTDNTAADLITDGCHMGIKSINRYMNQYSEADENSKNLAKRLIATEEELAKDIRVYL